MLKEESNGAYSPNTKSKSSGRSGITKLKTNQISPFAEQRRDQAEIVTDLGDKVKGIIGIIGKEIGEKLKP